MAKFSAKELKNRSKNCLLPEKIGGSRVTNFCKKVAEKRPENILAIIYYQNH
jgi:hypothetical protein